MKKMFNKNKIRIRVFRSNKEIYASVIDDAKGITLLSSSSLKIERKNKPVEVAHIVGEELGKKIAAKKIANLFFDRGRYKYHGQVKAVCEGIRKSGIKI